MQRIICSLILGCLAGVVAEPCQAHFLFIRVEPAQGQASSRAEVFFSEQATAGDPKFVEKIAQTKLWHAAGKGEYRPLVVNKLTDRLTADVAEAKSGAVVGVCEYGVLTREVPFLLRYYPKAIVGNPRESQPRAPRDEQAPEIMATFTADGVTLTLMRHGKPVPDVVLTTVDEELSNEEIKADASGGAVFQPKTAGYYCVYTKLLTKQAGESGGKAYSEIREFPTLAFPWPKQ